MTLTEPPPVPTRPTDRRVHLPRWHEFVPELVLGAGLLAFLLDEPDAALAASASSKATALVAAATLAWIGARLITWRFVPWSRVRFTAFLVAALGALAVVVLPAYDDTTVIESFPPMPSTPAAPMPVPIRSAPIEGIDHRANGTVSIYLETRGDQVVGLEEIDIQPGPDYDVFIVPGVDRDDTEGGIRLDDLRGNRGTQFYEVPADVEIGGSPWTVLVWCQTFDVPIANATPA
jgi:hypothetical protein